MLLVRIIETAPLLAKDMSMVIAQIFIMVQHKFV